MKNDLFRGRRINGGKWVYGDLVHDGYDGSSSRMEIGIAPFGCYPVEVAPDSVGQFSGVLDQTGEKIFQGHKVHGYIKEINLHVEGHVIFEQGYYGIKSDIIGITETFPLYGFSSLEIVNDDEGETK